MAHEAVLVLKQETPYDFIVGEGSAIEKGAFTVLVDPRTASGAATSTDAVCAGITRREKIATDGRTRLSHFRKGIFRVKASGAITLGAPLSLDLSPNHVKQAAELTASGAQVIGHSLEEAADGDVFEAAINIGAGF